MQDLWQAHYQILLIILLKEFMKLKVNTDMRIKTVNHVKLTTNIVGVFLITQTLKMIYAVTRIIKKN